MKKAPLLTILFTIVFVLAACGSGSASTNSVGSNPTTGNGFRNAANATGPLNPEAKLALGTIKLEGTQQAVDPKMAASLLPLWQLLYQLKSSSSTAPQEVTAVVDQIHATMTPVQLNTINGMKLSQADIFTVFQQQSQANGSGGPTGSGTTRTGGGNRGNGGGGGFVFVGGGPGGGPGGGGLGGGGFGNNGGAGSSTTTQATTLTAAQAAQARQNAVSSLLINQLIRLLETKLLG